MKDDTMTHPKENECRKWWSYYKYKPCPRFSEDIMRLALLQGHTSEARSDAEFYNPWFLQTKKTHFILKKIWWERHFLQSLCDWYTDGDVRVVTVRSQFGRFLSKVLYFWTNCSVISMYFSSFSKLFGCPSQLTLPGLFTSESCWNIPTSFHRGSRQQQ